MQNFLGLACILIGFFSVTQVIAQSITVRFPYTCSNEEKSCYATKRYHFVTLFKANFFKAHQYCQIHDMELLTIESKEEETVFLNLLNSKDFEFKQAKEFWTSGTDLGNEGKFFFLSTGKTIGHLSWARDEPNNARRTTEIKSSSETENCMAYTMTENLKFYRLFDRFCSLKFYFICQDIQRRQIKSNMHKNC